MKKEVIVSIAASKPAQSVHLSHVERSYAQTIGDVKNANREMLGKENNEERVIQELSDRTGQSIGRIKKLLAHSEYLSHECLTRLAELGADEDFFDAAQPVRRILTKNMLSRRLTHDQIEKDLSNALLEMWQEYLQRGKIDKNHWLKIRNVTSEQKQAWVPAKKAFGKPQMFKYRPPTGVGPLPGPLKPKQISRRLKALSKEIDEIAQKAEGHQCDLIQEVGKVLIKMISLHHSLLRGGKTTKGGIDHATLH
jgi:hypothetical protein